MSRKVFLSYAHLEKGFINLVMQNLKDERFEPWMDDMIPKGKDWINEIDKAIKGSFALVVFITPKSMESLFVTYEWSLAMGLGLEVLPVLLEETKNVHPRLEKIQYIDFTHYNFQWDLLIDLLGKTQEEFVKTERAVNTALNLVIEARKEREAENFPAALQTLKSALDYAKSDFKDNVYYEMALVHNQLGDQDKTIESLQKALESNADHIESLIMLGSIRRRQADKADTVHKREELLADAERIFRTVIEKQPRKLDNEGESVWGSLGGILKRREKIDEAIQAYKEAAKIKKSSYPYNNLGLLYLDRKKLKEMQQNFILVELFTRTKLLFDPSNEWAHNDHFVAKVARENIKEAKEAFSTLIIIAPDYALQSLRDTLVNMKAFEDFKPTVKRYIDEVIVRVDERLEELKKAVDI